MLKRVLILAVLFFIFSGCGSNKKEKVLHTYLSGVVPSLDPMYVTDRYSHTITRQVYEGLYQYHYLKQPYTIEPVIADGMPIVSKDSLTYTVKIKKNIFFIDDPCFVDTQGKGRELTADDVIYSFSRAIKDEGTKGILFSDLMREKLASMKKKDRYTVVFKLKERTPFFPAVLTRPNAFIVPREAVEYYKRDFQEHPVGTGPFKLQEWIKGNRIVLVKNDKYNASRYPKEGAFGDKEKGLLLASGKKLPFLDKVVVYILPDEEPRWMNFLKGVIDIVVPDKDTYYNAFPVGGELAPKLLSYGIQVTKMLKSETNFIVFNLRNSYLADKKALRQAISLAFDVEKYNALFYNNQVILANWIIPPNIFAYDPNSRNPYMGKDINRAKKLIVKQGIRVSDIPTLNLLVRDSLAGRQMGEFFARAMKELGIKVNLIQKKFSKIIKQLPTWQGYDLVFLRWRVDFPIVEDPLRLLYSKAASPGPNRSGYLNDGYDKLYEQISLLPEGKKKYELIKKAERIAREDLPLIPLFHPMLISLHHSYVKNYKPHLLVGDMYKYIDIDLEKKAKILKVLLH